MEAKNKYRGGMKLLEAEGEAMETLREWTRAQERPKLRARLQAWGMLRFMVGLFPAERTDHLAGDDWYTDDEKELLIAATIACDRFVKSRVKKAKKERKAANKS